MTRKIITMNRTIITNCIFPPIPDRRFDWCAFYEGEEERGQYGYGATDAEAVTDLTNNYPDEDDES